MILADYFRYPKDASWDVARQCGVSHGVLRLPEDGSFDLTDKSHWQTVVDDFLAHGITPVVIEPMPNEVHDHIKAGDDKRDESIEKVIKMLPIMRDCGIGTICFNWMAHVGWYRNRILTERGGASVTGFDIADLPDTGKEITADQLWANYTYFLNAVLPEAEKTGIKLALHPDDPPVPMRKVARIMSSYANIDRAVRGIRPSDNLGVTFCQSSYYIMGAHPMTTAPLLGDKIFFIHFRNVTGNKECFHETWHDNGDLDMPALMRLYYDLGLNVPIRVDHVPTLVGEDTAHQGYAVLGRLYALGYLKGIIQTIEGERQ